MNITGEDFGLAASPSDVYARNLLVKSIGHPLWFPEPSSYPPEYTRKGVGVGDVGVMSIEGHFDFLFNICLPSDHPINLNTPPEFQPLEFNGESDVITTPQMHTLGTVIASEGIQMEPFESDAEFQPIR
jgi:hypothetical protein